MLGLKIILSSPASLSLEFSRRKVEFSMDPIGISSYTKKYEGFLAKANNSLAPEQVNPNDYWAVYIGGGYGPLFDVANNPIDNHFSL